VRPYRDFDILIKGSEHPHQFFDRCRPELSSKKLRQVRLLVSVSLAAAVCVSPRSAISRFNCTTSAASSGCSSALGRPDQQRYCLSRLHGLAAFGAHHRTPLAVLWMVSASRRRCLTRSLCRCGWISRWWTSSGAHAGRTERPLKRHGRRPGRLPPSKLSRFSRTPLKPFKGLALCITSAPSCPIVCQGVLTGGARRDLSAYTCIGRWELLSTAGLPDTIQDLRRKHAYKIRVERCGRVRFQH
jgi:hypothetical protein